LQIHKAKVKTMREYPGNAISDTLVAEQIVQLNRLSRLEDELALASEIQEGMMPRSLPGLEGYEFGAIVIPAKFVGGDFFDFIPLGRDSLGIAVGDVSGKGVPAALFMAMARSLLRSEAHPDRSPKEVLEAVNRHLLSMNEKEMFVAVLFGILNRSTRQFSYARAGHEPPIFFDGKGSHKRMPKTNGQALGLFDAIALDEQTVEFSKDCMLLLYTDGIPDATNAWDQRFGLNKIVRTISRMPQPSAQMICSELIRAVTVHQGDGRQDDDMTVIVVRAV
jgi:sigma-B regulation protein RsbU (phosphoserine phosphatase)